MGCNKDYHGMKTTILLGDKATYNNLYHWLKWFTGLFETSGAPKIRWFIVIGNAACKIAILECTPVLGKPSLLQAACVISSHGPILGSKIYCWYLLILIELANDRQEWPIDPVDLDKVPKSPGFPSSPKSSMKCKAFSWCLDCEQYSYRFQPPWGPCWSKREFDLHVLYSS